MFVVDVSLYQTTDFRHAGVTCVSQSPPLGQEIKSASRLNLRGTSEVNMNKDIIWFFEIEQILLRSLQLQHRDR
jgi:hypothetical protein